MRTRVFYLYLITVTLLSLTSCDPLKKGVVFYNAHEYQKAIDFFSQKIAEQKYVKRSLLLRAYAHMNSGEYELAEMDFDRLIMVSEIVYVYTFLNEAICCLYLGKVDKAASFVKDAMRAEEANAVAAMLRGFIYIYNEKYEDALRDINFAGKYMSYQGIRWCDRSCIGYYKALLYNKLGRLEDAVDQFNSLQKSGKEFEYNYYALGCCYLKNRQKEAANKYFKLCIDSTAKNSIEVFKAKIRLGYPPDSMLTAGMPPDSVILNDTAVSEAYRHYNLACYYSLKKDYEKSVSYLAQAFEKNFFGLVYIRLDYDIEELNKYYDLNKLYLSHGKKIVVFKNY
ncbi:MAG TPA: hypothetical protein VJY62_14535 [Bacteroidia bacterium]|nr:hypothetical protein [Bacteroidia bacterium]